MPAQRTGHADDSLLAAPLLALTERTLRAPATVLVGACALALLSVAVTVNGLTFKTSRLDLLNPRSEYNQRWLAYLTEFGNRDDACLVIRAERKKDLTAAIDEVGESTQDAAGATRYFAAAVNDFVSADAARAALDALGILLSE